MESKRKQKGGAQKVREKKRKLLETEAGKCTKLSELFTRQPQTSKGVIYSTIENKCCDIKFNNECDGKESASEHYKRTAAIINEDKEPCYTSLDTSALQGLFATVPDAEGISTSEEYASYIDEIAEDTEHQNLVEDENATCNDKNETSECMNNRIYEDIQTETGVSNLNNDDNNMKFFKRPNNEELETFFAYHPQQSSDDPVILKTFYRKDKTKRVWLTYNKNNSALFCMICLAFSKATESNKFIEGFTDKRHIHQRIEEHESSESHKKCAEAYFFRNKKANISNLLFSNQMKIRHEQVRKRRLVMERIIEIVKLIGKRGLSYRGHNIESAYSLENKHLDHGNFLDIILLVAKYDVCLQEHISDCISKSKIHQASGDKGRGNLVTMLSKNTINYVIDTLGEMTKEMISTNVSGSGMFSLQIDTTQDVTSRDQCSIVIRYIKDDLIQEKLLAVVHCKVSTGEGLKNLVIEVLNKCNIDVDKCIGSSTDGAANMQGQYNGFSAWLSSECSNTVHVWCYAHVLNLVLSDTTSSVIQCISLFNLLNDISVFIKDSHTRMDIWESVSEDSNYKRLTKIGETRWWSKSVALKKIFGSLERKESSLFLNVILTLEKIEKDNHIKPDARIKAKSYKEALLKYETILTAHIFLHIFHETTPLSKYLQTSGLDILKAFNMVKVTNHNLSKLREEFEIIKQKADSFVSWMNEQIDENSELDFEIERLLPEKRSRKKKSMPGEKAQDEVIEDSVEAYRIKVFNVIIDTVNTSLDKRFNKSQNKFYADLALLDPKNFSVITNGGLHSLMFEELSKKLIPFDNRATAENLQHELTHLAQHWHKLKQSPLEEYTTKISTGFDTEDDNDMSEAENTIDTDICIEEKICSSCNNCSICCYRLLKKYNLLTGTYSIIGLAYEYMLTLSFTQVSCERSFSILKYIKNRLRSTLNQEKLDSFMLMASEKEIVANIEVEKIIDRISNKSGHLKKLLQY